MSRRLLTSGFVAAAAFIAGPFVASAQAHYYGIYNVPVSGLQGAQGVVETNNFGIPNVGSNFLDNEVWVVNRNNNPNTWVETGLDKGVGGYGCSNTTEPHFFWADQRPGGSYNCHQSSNTASLDTDYAFNIDYEGGGSWVVGTGGFSGTSTGNQTSANLLQGGIEETSTDINTCGHLRELVEFTASGSHDWPSPNPSFFTQAPANAAWDTRPTSFRDWSNQSCSASDPGAGAISTSGAFEATPQQAQAHAIGPLTSSQITAIATSMAAGAGDAAPTNIQYVAASTRQQANNVASGDIVPSSSPSIVVAMQGSFVANNVPVPEGAAPPSGSVMTLVIDATTGQVTDLGIQGSYPDLSSLGAVSHTNTQ